MEDAGRIRRGYFVGGVAATQFAVPAALDLLRSLKEQPDRPEVVTISATDPANPYGTMLRWPAPAGNGPEMSGRGPTRSVGAMTVLVNGELAAYITRGTRQLLVFLPEDEPQRSATGRALSERLASMAREESGMLIAEVNGLAVSDHPLAAYLIDAGFTRSGMGYLMARRHVEPPPDSRAAGDEGTREDGRA
jgi:ATP-dependent Lhr-like helicase